MQANIRKSLYLPNREKINYESSEEASIAVYQIGNMGSGVNKTDNESVGVIFSTVFI